MKLQVLREEVAVLHQELPRGNLVAWTSGNLSARDAESGLVVIKPSGLKYENLTPESMVVVDLEGRMVEGDHKPSSDTASHCYVYRQMPEVHGMVHTHSAYATAWAAVGRDIPCFLTAMADEFGGPIPCGGFAAIGGEEIGEEVVRVLTGHVSPAVVMQNHGVIAVGTSPEGAIKAAIMCEDVARTSFLATRLGEPVPIDPEDIARLHQRYTTQYGQ
jgi:L-ribulose-5-phosphate 4-epimerase